VGGWATPLVEWIAWYQRDTSDSFVFM
jgi:hypothetical protein